MTDTQSHHEMANGYRITAHNDDAEQNARSFAAQLPRGDERVERIDSSPVACVTIWIKGGVDNFFASDLAPDGFEVEDVFISEIGGVGIEVVQK